MARILIMEDEATVRKVIRKIMERAGHDVTEASDGMDGMAKIGSKPADLVIADIIMPNKDGLETIIDLKQQFPDVKIIAISGGGAIGPDRYLSLAKGFGADAALQKPVGQNELLNAVHNLLGDMNDELKTVTERYDGSKT